ncbi:MAG: ankyrin repeat domain-containing protein [Gammaproteobacteria bacterium]|nr:MAG: ankyrin repeat domain-containing protein [Gammaproteobacteria bacterium]
MKFGLVKTLFIIIYLYVPASLANDNLGQKLKIAIDNDNNQKVESLLKIGANPNYFKKFSKKIKNSRNYRIPLFLAIRKNNIEIVKTLLEYGANPNVFRSGKPPLYYSSTPNRLKIFRLLLKHKANPDIMLSGKSLLFTFITMLEEKPFMAKALDILLKSGANPNIGNSNLTPLEYAVTTKDEALVTKLLKFGADPNLINRKGYTATKYAIALYGKEAKITKTLFKAGGTENKVMEKQPRYWFERKDPNKYVSEAEKERIRKEQEEKSKPKKKTIYH